MRSRNTLNSNIPLTLVGNSTHGSIHNRGLTNHQMYSYISWQLCLWQLVTLAFVQRSYTGDNNTKHRNKALGLNLDENMLQLTTLPRASHKCIQTSKINQIQKKLYVSCTSLPQHKHWLNTLSETCNKDNGICWSTGSQGVAGPGKKCPTDLCRLDVRAYPNFKYNILYSV